MNQRSTNMCETNSNLIVRLINPTMILDEMFQKKKEAIDRTE
jgi:hypothetical protein